MKNEMKTYHLKNGLTLYFYPDKNKHSVLVNLIVPYGGMDSDFSVEKKDYHMPDGMAHFLEHYVLEEGNYGNLMNRFGAAFMIANGYTYSNRTHFFFDAVTEVESGLEWLILGIHSVPFISDKIEKTKHAIREEIRMGQDKKDRQIALAELENLFPNLPYRSIAGTISQIDSISVETAALCYRAFYHPQNEFLVVAGNFDEDWMLQKIESLYDTLSFSDFTTEKKKNWDLEVMGEKKSVIQMPTGTPITELAFKINLKRWTKKELLRLDFYIHYFFRMNFSKLSPLYQTLVTKGIIKDHLIYGKKSVADYMILTVGAYTEKADDFMEQVLKFLKDPIFDEEIFDLELKDTAIDLLLRPEKLSSIVFPFVANVIEFDSPYLDCLEDLKDFTFSDFTNRMRELSFDSYTVLFVEDVNDI